MDDILYKTTILKSHISIEGTYRHYKGLLYQVLAVGLHSETLEELVIYQALYGEKLVWVRPLTMFLESITIEDKTYPRFTKVDCSD